MRAFIGLGSNLGDGAALIRTALQELDQQDSVQVVRRSSLYRSAAWGLVDQPDFTNAVAELETGLTPEQLLAVLLETETLMGRDRQAVRWGPRCIDLDLLCCGDLVIHGPGLELPHPRLYQRAFVLIPLLELDPDVYIPGSGSARNCLDQLEKQQVKRLT